jgi:hypothetical protein
MVLRFAKDLKVKQIPRYAGDFGARLRRGKRLNFASLKRTKRWGGAEVCLFLFLLLY